MGVFATAEHVVPKVQDVKKHRIKTLMACSRQTLRLKGGAAWHFIPLFFLFGKMNWHKRRNLLCPELKRRRAAAEGTMAVRCRLLSGQNWVIPTQSISTRLCRSKMANRSSAWASVKARVTKQWLVVSTPEMKAARPTVGQTQSACIGMGWADVLVHPRLGLFLAPQQTSAESGQCVCVPGDKESMGNSSEYQSKQIQERASWGSSSLAWWWELTKAGDGWTDPFSGAVTSRDMVTFMEWVWVPVITAMLGASWLLCHPGEDRAEVGISW